MKNSNALDLSLQLFMETGEISYFLLYKALKDEKTNGRTKNNWHCNTKY